MSHVVSVAESGRRNVQGVVNHGLECRMPFIFMLRIPKDAAVSRVNVPVHELDYKRIAAVYEDLRVHAMFVANDLATESTVYVPVVFWDADAHESMQYHSGDHWSLWLCHYERSVQSSQYLRIDAQIHVRGLCKEVANSVMYRGVQPRDVSEKQPLSAAAFTYYSLGTDVSAGRCGVPPRCAPTDARDYMKGAVPTWMTYAVSRSLRVSFERLAWNSVYSKQPDMSKPHHKREYHCTLHLAEYKGTAMQLLESPLLEGRGCDATVEELSGVQHVVFPLIYEGHELHQMGNRLAHVRRDYIAQKQQRAQSGTTVTSAAT